MKKIIVAKANSNHKHFFQWFYSNPVERVSGKGKWVRVKESDFLNAIERATDYEIDKGGNRVYFYMSDI